MMDRRSFLSTTLSVPLLPSFDLDLGRSDYFVTGKMTEPVYENPNYPTELHYYTFSGDGDLMEATEKEEEREYAMYVAIHRDYPEVRSLLRPPKEVHRLDFDIYRNVLTEESGFLLGQRGLANPSEIDRK